MLGQISFRVNRKFTKSPPSHLLIFSHKPSTIVLLVLDPCGVLSNATSQTWTLKQMDYEGLTRGRSRCQSKRMMDVCSFPLSRIFRVPAIWGLNLHLYLFQEQGRQWDHFQYLMSQDPLQEASTVLTLETIQLLVISPGRERSRRRVCCFEDESISQIALLPHSVGREDPQCSRIVASGVVLLIQSSVLQN